MKGLRDFTFAILVGAIGLAAAAQPSGEQLESARTLCSQYGYSAGTDAFARCVQTTVEQGVPMSEEERQKAVFRCESAMYAIPGSQSTKYRNVAKCASDPNAHLKLQQQPDRAVTCMRNGVTVTCVPF